MPEAETLDRLFGIVTALQPLGGMTRGTPLKSADWNVLVSAVMDLARLSVSRERIIEKLLSEQASGGVEGGPAGGDPGTLPAAAAVQAKALAAELRGARAEVASLRTDLGAAAERIRKLEQGLLGLRDADRVRQDSLEGLGHELGKMRGLEDRLGQVTQAFAGVDGKLDRALDVGEKLLSGNDNPLAAVTRRLEAVEGLRDHLLLADGTLAQLRDIERDLETVKRVPPGAVDVDKLRGELLAGTRATLDERLAPVTGALADLRGAVDALPPRLGRAEGRLGAVEALGPRLTAVEGGLAATGALGGRVGAVEARLGGLDALGGRLSNVEARMPTLDELEGRVKPLEAGAAQATNRLGALESSMAASTTRLDKLEARAPLLDSALASLARLEPLRELPAQVKALETEMVKLRDAGAGNGARLDLVEAQVDDLAVLPQRLRTVETQLASQREVIDGANLPGLVGRVAVTEAAVAAHGQALGRVDGLARQVGALGGRVQVTEARIAEAPALSTKVTEAIARLDALERRVIR